MEPLVSVIIPTYNRQHTLFEAIASVKRQTYQNIQLIVVDDGSTDDTLNLLKEVEGVEVYAEVHRGQGATRNTGLKYAKGFYIASLDSDDIWGDTFLEDSITCIEKHSLDFVFSNWVSQSNGKRRRSDWERSNIWKKYQQHCVEEWCLLTPLEIRKLFIETCPAPSSSLVICRSCLFSGWDEDMKIADDWSMMLEIIMNKSCRGAFSILPKWRKRIHETNIYDGQHFMHVIEKLGFHDEPILWQKYTTQLTRSEKHVIRTRKAWYHFNYSLLVLKNNFAVLGMATHLTKAFREAPLGMVRISFKRLRSIVKFRIWKLKEQEEEIT